MHFFCIFCLTNCWPCGIMEIRAAWAWAARKKPPMEYPQGLWFMWCRGSELNRHSLLPQQVFYHLELPRHESGFCILRILDIVSACEVWFTFIYRIQEHHAVGSWDRGLTDSRGSLFRVALPSPFVPLLYHAFAGLSRTFFISS